MKKNTFIMIVLWFSAFQHNTVQFPTISLKIIADFRKNPCILLLTKSNLINIVLFPDT